MEHVFLEIFEVVTFESFSRNVLPLCLESVHLVWSEVYLPLIYQEEANLNTDKELIVVLLLDYLIHNVASTFSGLIYRRALSWWHQIPQFDQNWIEQLG